MKRFKKILVFAGSATADEPAIRRAASLAKSNNATVELVDVIDELPAYARLVTPSNWNLPGLIAGERGKRLEELAGSLKEEDVQVSAQVLTGKPAVAITQHVLREKHDLVLKTARPEEFSQRLFYGTLAKKLLRVCPCPVWIIQPSQPPRFERIAAAIDPNEDDEQTTALNTRLIEMASSLAERESSELDVVHAWSPYGVTLVERIAKDQLDQYVADCETEVRQRVDRFLSRFGNLGDNTHVRLLQGEPENAIIDFISKHNVDLVVMGTVCRTGISGYLIGNTAEKVLRHLGSSVLAVKPEGFQSPVTVPAAPSVTYQQDV